MYHCSKPKLNASNISYKYSAARKEQSKTKNKKRKTKSAPTTLLLWEKNKNSDIIYKKSSCIQSVVIKIKTEAYRPTDVQTWQWQYE